jgi:hypothetical protein
MNQKELDKILHRHKGFLLGRKWGVKAHLRGADLSHLDLHCLDLSHLDLSYANLSHADLHHSNLKYSNLRDSNLSHATLINTNLIFTDLSYADLRHSSLRDSDLSNANLKCSDLRYSNLRGADLCGVMVNIFTQGFFMRCPETGSFDAWKKCKYDVIVKLRIPAKAKRSSATSNKCRASEAIVLEVYGANAGISTFDPSFVYREGETVSVGLFDSDRWDECSTGIHFFMTRQEAELY